MGVDCLLEDSSIDGAYAFGKPTVWGKFKANFRNLGSFIRLYQNHPSYFHKPDGTIRVSKLWLEIVGLIIMSDFLKALHQLYKFYMANLMPSSPAVLYKGRGLASPE